RSARSGVIGASRAPEPSTGMELRTSRLERCDACPILPIVLAYGVTWLPKCEGVRVHLFRQREQISNHILHLRLREAICRHDGARGHHLRLAKMPLYPLRRAALGESVEGRADLHSHAIHH